MTTTSRLEKIVANALRRAGYSGTDTGIVVGVSGGPDSSALLYCLHQLCNAHRLSLHVAHLNHDFRGEEAEEDARFVANKARQLGLSATIEKQDPLEYQRQHRISSFEQAAREMRYSFLAKVARDVGAATVAVGHTADDLAETVLEHILRGSGLDGLRGMTEVSTWPWPPNISDVTLFRPLLEVTKVEAAAYCQELGQDFREDSGNWLPQFMRNRVRHQLLPYLAAEYNPRIRDALVRLARSTALELDYLEQEIDRVWPKVVSNTADTTPVSLQFHRQALASLHPAVQRRLLRRGYAYITGETRRLRESHLKSMSEMVQSPGSGRTTVLPGGLRLHATHDSLIMSGDNRPPCPFPIIEGELLINLSGLEQQSRIVEFRGWLITLELVSSWSPPRTPPGDAFTACLDLDELGESIHIRSRRPGDRFQPLGMAGRKKLQDFFTDVYVPRGWRDRVPLVVASKGIAWVVGYRIADWAKVKLEKPGYSPVLRMKFEEDIP
ncbi:MAG TPA: tRNA lysidine(34) synthetase TilS [Dehalococcoidia bacterium]|nr:tRNA lysidine(34) synthetase TilS [Dehalococcoidia bacterium]